MPYVRNQIPLKDKLLYNNTISLYIEFSKTSICLYIFTRCSYIFVKYIIYKNQNIEFFKA